ncbi:MAG TPA: hypothetical protein VGM56_07755 [Byssovorax sp.]|jgi:hypothetical protein
MKRLGRLLAALSFSLLLGAPLASTGCAGGEGSGKTANVAPGDMPAGASWNGVYYSELYGYLHVVTDGSNFQARWLRPGKDRWGEMHGTVAGDLLKFDWTEHTIGTIGPGSEKTGKGYLKYKRPPGDNVDDTIAGEIGHGSDETGDPWDGIKQRNMTPDLKSIGGTGAADLGGGGDWDQNKQSGAPEPPKAP